MPKIGLTRQFGFFGVSLTGQFENLGRLTVLVMVNKAKRTILSYFGGQDNFIFKRFECTTFFDSEY